MEDATFQEPIKIDAKAQDPSVLILNGPQVNLKFIAT